MRWSRALSAGIAFVAITLAIKAVAIGRSEPADDRAAYLGTVAQRLVAAGFTARIDRRGFVTAVRGECRLKARDLPPMGTARLAYERLGADFGPTRYGWRGEWLGDPPKYGPLMIFYGQRELARLGIVTRRAAIASVAASSACRTLPAALFDAAIEQR